MSDYYELLGVESDADKESIRSAYRDALEGASSTEKARLNRAWNVLSDPVQRERYDEAREEGWLDDAEEEEDSDVPTRRAPATRERAGARPVPEPTIVLPEGMRFAENRERGNALLIDFLILFVIYALALSLVLPAAIKAKYPNRTDRIDAINKQIDKLDKQKSAQDKVANGDKSSLTDNKKPTKAQEAAAKKESKALDKQITKRQDRITEISKDFQGFALLLYGALLTVFLLIVVPATALTGQTLGMRLRKVKVVRIDGSPVGWGGAFGRFFPPLAIALLIPQLGAIVGLGMVLWFFRDRNHQGFHDKLARTLVVASTS